MREDYGSLDKGVTLGHEPLFATVHTELVAVGQKLVVASNGTKAFVRLDKAPGGSAVVIHLLAEGEENFHVRVSCVLTRGKDPPIGGM